MLVCILPALPSRSGSSTNLGDAAMPQHPHAAVHRSGSSVRLPPAPPAVNRGGSNASSVASHLRGASHNGRSGYWARSIDDTRGPSKPGQGPRRS